MEPQKEKRGCERYEYHTPMDLYRMDFQDDSYYSEMKDYSQGGLSLLTKEKLIVGQFVYLEMKNFDKQAKGPEKYKSYSGCVKWASPYSSSTRDTNGAYQYGIEYSESVQYPC